MIEQKLANGDSIPSIGLGTWKSEPGEVGAAVREALRIGYRHVDCARIYMNEPEIGAALTAEFSEGQVRREDVWITSKLWNDSHEAERVRPALESTLRDLQLEQLDLYLIHWPVASRHDVLIPERGDEFLTPEQAPLTETWAALEDCVRAGLCRHIGVSNFTPKKIEAMTRNASIQPSMCQVEMHPYLPQDDLLAWCKQNGIAVTAYSPLGSPDRPERVRRASDPSLLEHDVVRSIAERHNVVAAQVLIRWAIERETVVIPKSTNPTRLAQNLAAADLELTPDDMAQMREIEGPYRFVYGAFWELEGGPYTVDWLWND